MMLDIKTLLDKRVILVLAVIYSCTITVLFLMPSSDLPRVNLPGGADKIVHFLIHFGLVILWQLYFLRKNKNTLSLKHITILLLAIILYGIIIELLQGYLTVSRTPDFYDVVANFGGAVVGVLVFQKVKRFFTF